MQNISEEICGEYLKNILKCNFVSYNITNPDIQGEIDVVGIKLEQKEIYVCEVAAHIQGLQYVKNNQPDDFNRFYAKFKKDIKYSQKYFKDYTIFPMLWSPIVKKSGQKAKYNTCYELERLQMVIENEFQLKLSLIINENFEVTLNELKKFASGQSAEFSSPVMRLFQIEKYLERHLKNLKKKND